MRVLHVTNFPTPYRVAISNTICQLLRSRHDDYVVLFQAKTATRRAWRDVLGKATFHYAFVQTLNIHIGKEKSWLLPSGLWPALRRLAPNVIVVAGMGFDALTCLLYAKVHRVPLAIHSGAIEVSPHASFREESLLGQWLRARMRKKLFFPHVDAWIAYGTQARSYLENRSVNPAKIFISANTVEVAPLLALSRKHRAVTNEKPFQVLYAGMLNQRKGFDLLLEVAHRVKERVLFHVVGGDLTSLPKAWRQHRRPEHLVFHGYIQPEHLPFYYQLADCFLFLSRSDVFGLVMVEAAAAGLPIIASQYAGGATDIVKPEVNGFIVDPGRIEEIAAMIDHLAVHPELAHRFGRASRRIIRERFLVSQSAHGWIEAVDFAHWRHAKAAERMT